MVLGACALAACGGVTAADEPAASRLDAGEPPGVPSFGDAGVTMHAPVACERCSTNAECGGQAACVASVGAAFCAPGCSKDGFCPSDRTCSWVHGPDGQTWRACLPDHDPCGPILVMPRDHAGTW